MKNKTVTVLFRSGTRARTATDEFFQFDTGRKMKFGDIDLPFGYQVHFANRLHGVDALTQIGDEDGVLVPEQFLATGETVYAWLWLDGQTEGVVTMPVTKRSKPGDVAPSPAEKSVVEQAVDALNAGVAHVDEALETAQESIDATLEAAEQAKDDAETAQENAEASATSAAVSAEAAANTLNAANNRFVRYDTAQTLTNEQKSQARENIGVTDAGSTFVAVYGQTTQEEVTAAVQNGLQVVAMKDGIAYPMTFRSPLGSCEFCIVNGRVINCLQLLSSGWSQSSYGEWAEVDSPVLIRPRATQTPADGSNSTLLATTEFVQRALANMLNGSVTVTGTTPAITALPGVRYVCDEVATLDITLPASGCIDVVFESGSTATVLTITPPTGVTLKWANGFDPTALDANTTYEINIADGLGVAGSWT